MSKKSCPGYKRRRVFFFFVNVFLKKNKRDGKRIVKRDGEKRKRDRQINR